MKNPSSLCNQKNNSTKWNKNGEIMASIFGESITTFLLLGIMYFKFQRRSKEITNEHSIIDSDSQRLKDTSLYSVFTIILRIFCSVKSHSSTDIDYLMLLCRFIK